MANTGAVAQGVLAILKSVNAAVLAAAADRKAAGPSKLAPKDCGRCPKTGLPLAPVGGKR